VPPAGEQSEINPSAFAEDTQLRCDIYMHEWSYEKQADYLVLRYLHEVWDTESTEFTIECRAGEKTALTISYDVMGDNYFNAYKRKQLKPKMEIQSVEGQLTVLGEGRRRAAGQMMPKHCSALFKVRAECCN
jgi:hypothetical protein